MTKMPKVKHTYKPEMVDGRKVTFKYKTGICGLMSLAFQRNA